MDVTSSSYSQNLIGASAHQFAVTRNNCLFLATSRLGGSNKVPMQLNYGIDEHGVNRDVSCM